MIFREFASGLSGNIVLCGPSGVGKTWAFNQIISNLNPKILMVNTTELLKGMYPYKREGLLWDVPEFTANFLKRNHSLSDLETTLDSNEMKRGTKFKHVFELDTNQALRILLNEAKSQNIPICIDGVNALFSETKYHDEDSNVLHASSFYITSLLYPFLKSSNVISATTGSKHEEMFREMQRIEVPGFNVKETSEFLELMKKNKLLKMELDPKYVRLVTAGNGRKMSDFCRNPLPM